MLKLRKYSGIVAILVLVLFLFVGCGVEVSVSGGGNGTGSQPNGGAGFGNQAGQLGALKESITGTETALTYFHNKGLSAGWNLGNSLDAINGGIPNETAWGNPVITDSIFKAVKKSGFNVVRIPITWGSQPRDNTARLNRVGEVVAMAHSAGLVVIINTHHDDGWLDLNTASTNTTQRASMTKAFKDLWTEIATRFKDYGEWLIFEALNEPRQIISGESQWDSPNNNTVYTIINEWNQAFTSAVRATGGNNSRRILQYNAYAAKPKCTEDTTFKLPTDSAQSRQVVSFHFYEPEEFCLKGGMIWGGPDYDSAIDFYFSAIRQRFGDKIPIVIGECGVSYQGARTGTNKTDADKSRVDYYGYLGEKAKEYNMVPVVWDNGSYLASKNDENFGLYNRGTGASNSNNCAACVNALIKAVKRN